MFLSFGYLGLSPDTGSTLCQIALWDCFWGQNWPSFLCDLVEANKRSAHWTRFQNSLLAPPSPRVHKTIPWCNRKQHPPVSRLSSKWPIFRFWVQYAYFWLSPSGKQRQILALGPKRVQCTLSTRHKWPVKNAVVNLAIRLKGNSANSLSPFEAQNKDMGFVAQTLLTRIRLRLQRKHAFN